MWDLPKSVDNLPVLPSDFVLSAVDRPFRTGAGEGLDHSMTVFIARWTAACCLILLPALTAADEQRDRLLDVFVEEFVTITPGAGKFPATLSIATPADVPPDVTGKVSVAGPFSIARYEVPQNLYQAVMGVNPSKWKGPRNSVEMVAYTDAVLFCEKVTALLRERQKIAAHEEVRLPTEIEWEYCCRAGTVTAYSFGDDIRRPGDPEGKNSVLDEYAWYTGNAQGNDPPVGALKPNPWGLYDMHGYLSELTSTRWTPYLGDSQKNPDHGSENDKFVVIRGGSWKERAEFLRSDSRRKWSRTLVDDAVGFRCIRATVAK